MNETVYVYELPEEMGGGKLALREVPLIEQQRLRRKHLSGKKSTDASAFLDLQDELVMSSLQGCSANLAAELGVQGNSRGDLVVVSDSDGGRQQLWHRLTSRQRSICTAAYSHIHAVDEEVLAPLLARQQARLE